MRRNSRFMSEMQQFKGGDLAGIAVAGRESATLRDSRRMTTAVGRTHPGRRRTENEDCYLVDEALQLFAIADGMGGHRAGEVASRIGLDTVADFVRTSASDSGITWPYGPERSAVIRGQPAAERDSAGEPEDPRRRAGITRIARGWGPRWSPPACVRAASSTRAWGTAVCTCSAGAHCASCRPTTRGPRR